MSDPDAAPRRGLGAAVAGCAIAGGVVVFAAGRRWIRYAIESGQTSAGASGHDVAAGATALGFVLLAGVVALPATRGWLRRAIGLLLAAAGAGTIAVASRVVADPAGAAGSRPVGFFATVAHPNVTVRATGWPWVDVAAGLLGAAAGVLTIARSAAWPAMGRRFEAGGARGARASQATDSAALWDRLDDGDDPTA